MDEESRDDALTPPDGEDAEGRPRIRDRVENSLRPLTLPNVLTMIRMAMVPFFVLAVNEHDFRLALWTFVIAGLTDSLDGYLARALSMRSRFGAYLDPIADKLLITAAYVALTVPQGQAVAIPLWLTILALFRDGFIMLVALALYLVEGLRHFPPSILGKLTTTMQVVTIAVVLLANLAVVPGWLPPVCFYTSFVLVIVSGFNYIFRVGRLIEARQRPGAE